VLGTIRVYELILTRARTTLDGSLSTTKSKAHFERKRKVEQLTLIVMYVMKLRNQDSFVTQLVTDRVIRSSDTHTNVTNYKFQTDSRTSFLIRMRDHGILTRATKSLKLQCSYEKGKSTRWTRSITNS